MRVVLLITRLDRGGSADVTLQLAEGLVQRGFRVWLISGKTDDPAYLVNRIRDTAKLPIYYENHLVRSIHPFHDLMALFKLRQRLARIRPHILHTNSSKAGIIGRITGKSLHVPMIAHSPHGHIFYGYYNRFITRIFIWIEKWMAHYTTVIINLTRKGKQDHIHLKIARESKFTTNPCGVDLAPFRKTSKPDTAGQITVGWVGRLVTVKDPLTFIRAAKTVSERYPDVRYLIIGDGELISSCKALVSQLNLRNVEFPGFRDDLPGLYSIMDIFVLSSVNEGLGRVLIEAMASGLPVVATNVGGVPDIIRDGVNGYLVPPGDPGQMADRMIRLIGNPGLRKTIGNRNKINAEDFSINTYIERTIEIYSTHYYRTHES